jgi:TonB family protein
MRRVLYGLLPIVALTAVLGIAADSFAQSLQPPSYPWSTNVEAVLGDPAAACAPSVPGVPRKMTWSGRCVHHRLEGKGTLHLTPSIAHITAIAATFRRGIAEGAARIEFVDGSAFEGLLHANRPNGPGAFDVGGGARVEGVYKDDLLAGRVTFRYAAGMRREAAFVDGNAEGPVVEFFPDGARSEFIQHDRHRWGAAAMTFADGSRIAFNYTNHDAVFTGVDGKAETGVFIAATPDPALWHAPVYPPLSIRLNEVGTALLSFVIGADGAVSDVRLQLSTGAERLDNAATAAALTWRYKPATFNGRPIATPKLLSLPFTLSLPPPAAAPPPATGN